MNRNLKNKSNKKKNKNKQPERFQPKVLFIWLVIFATIIGLWSLYPVQEASQKAWTMQEVIKEAQAGNIERGSIKSDPARGTEWYVVKGQLKTPLTEVVNGKEVTKPAMFVAEGRLTNDMFNELMGSQSGKVIIEKPASNSFGDLLLNLLPFLF